VFFFCILRDVFVLTLRPLVTALSADLTSLMLVSRLYGTDAVDGYDPALMMDGTPEFYDDRLMYNGAGRYVQPSVAPR